MFSGEYEENVGLCLEMCSEKERKFREEEKLLHPFEILLNTKDNKIPSADIEKTVKCYARSAAGKNITDPETLRPPRILLSTIDYLLNNVFLDEEYEWNIVYDFINDRLKAIRQDMVVQNLPKASSVAIMQPIVRFYAYSAYRLCELPIRKFDPKLNASELQECLIKLLSWYDEFDVLEEIVENCGHDFSNALYFQSRPEIEAMYIIFQLGNSSAINRALKLPKKWKCPLVKKVLSISLCAVKGNWVKVCRNIKTLPILLKCLAILKLPEIRRNALQIMSVAYFSKNSLYPLCNLKDLLYYTACIDVKCDCKYYNIICDEDYAHFQSKTSDTIKIENKPYQDKKVNGTLEKWSVPFILLNGSPRNKGDI